MIDGLKTEDYKGDDITLSDDLIVADLVSGTGLDLYGSTAYLTSTLSVAGAVSGANTATFSSLTADGKTLSAVGAGSPTPSWGYNVVVGSISTGAGSNVWLTYPTGVSSPKAILVQNVETFGDASFAPAGSWGAGSCYVATTSASQDVYFAIIS